MGAVNIFLGGTGKAVAQDLQDSLDFYGLDIGSPIAFDLDAEMGDGIALELIAPGPDLAEGVRELARAWNARHPGRALEPPPAGPPGPQLRPENALLAEIGNGVISSPRPSAGLYALRAHGLCVFSLLFDDEQAIAGAGAGVALRRAIAERAAAAARSGGELRINITTSTAGGTGAGTFLPLALWLRQQYPVASINLIAVTPSAFESVLDGDPILRERAVKGRSGTYAILRELSYLGASLGADDHVTPRRIPVTGGDGVPYRPGDSPFDRVFWFGGRRGNTPADAFEEAGELVRLLSHDASALIIAGQTGGAPMQHIGAATAIEYPKLRYQRRIISAVLQRAYRELSEGAPGYPGQADMDYSVFQYTAASDGERGPLGQWFEEHRYGALGDSGGIIEAGATETLIDGLLDAADAGAPYNAAVPHGTSVQGANYHGARQQWQSYTGHVSAALEAESTRRQPALAVVVRAARAGEARDFGQWLLSEADRSLGGAGSAPVPARALSEAVERIERRALALSERFAADIHPSGRTLQEADRAITDARDRFDAPPPLSVWVSMVRRGLGVAAGLLAFTPLAAISGLLAGHQAGPLPLRPVAVALAFLIGFVAFRAAAAQLARPARQAASLPERRRMEERALFAAYAERDRARSWQWMLREIRGLGDNLPLFTEFRQQAESLREQVDRLADVYDSLEAKASADASKASRPPSHVAEEVGKTLVEDPAIAQAAARALHRRIRIRVDATPASRAIDIRMRIAPDDDSEEGRFNPALVSAEKVLHARSGQPEGGLDAAVRDDREWRDSAWSLVNWQLGQSLPDDFADALRHPDLSEEAAAASLAVMIGALHLPREPSLLLRGVAASAPSARRVYVGTNAIEGLYNQATRAERRVLDDYGPSEVIPALGEQIVFLDLWADPGNVSWAPGVVGHSDDARRSRDTYYGAGGDPPSATAEGECFTVLPELLAATKLELGGEVKPLPMPVVARLHGSDIDTAGPTYAELYYLLRSRGWIATATSGLSTSSRRRAHVARPGEPGLGLAEWPLGAYANETWGAGRGHLVVFDAFSEFLSFDGRPIVNGDEEHGIGVQSRVHRDEWARAHDRGEIVPLQRDVVRQWYTGDTEADAEAMLRALQEDLDLMANADPAIADAWARVMTRLIADPRRLDIRRQHLAANRP